MPDIITTAAAFRRERYGISNNHDDVFLTRYLGNDVSTLPGMSCMMYVRIPQSARAIGKDQSGEHGA